MSAKDRSRRKRGKQTVAKKASKQVSKKAHRAVKAPAKSKRAKKTRAPQVTKRPNARPLQKKLTKKTLQRKAVKGKSVPRPVAKRRLPKRQAMQQDFFAKVAQQAAPEQPKVHRQYPIVEGADSERVKMLVPLLRDLVRKGTITDWRINLAHVRSANSYTTGFVPDDEIAAIREDVLVTVYRRFPDGTMGEAQLPIVTTDAGAARQQLTEIAAVCEHARKQAFRLPDPAEHVTFPQGHDERMRAALFSGEGQRVPHEILAQVKAQMALIKDVKVNAMEILASASAVRVLNSNGVDVSYHKTAIYLEIVMSAKREEEQEFHWSTVVVSPEQLNLLMAIPRQAQIARDAVIAKPNEGFTGDVLLSQQSLTEFFTPNDTHNPQVLHSFARLKLMGLTKFEPGTPVGQFRGEPFTLLSNPAVPLGLLTAPVDEEGTPLSPVEIVRNGVFQRYVASARYGQQLGVPVTGNMSNVQVGDGATREEHLRGNNYFEVVSFSWFNPDPFSGDFSAEIRLGYRWIQGKKTPVRGGHLVGNVFQSLLHARFSREVMQSGRYYGPRAMLLKEATVTK